MFLAVLGVLLPGAAHAWVEVRVLAHEAKLAVDRSAVARVEHRVTLRVAGSPLPTFDVRGVDIDALLDRDAYVVAARDAQAGSMESAVPVSAERVERRDDDPPGTVVRLRFSERGLPRGLWVVVFRYKTDLGERGLVRTEGAVARLKWTGPVWSDGLDSLRTTITLPPAPTEPAVDEPVPGEAADGAANAAENGPTFLSTLRRTAEEDELSLLRPYASKNEAVTWSVRVDPRAFRGPAQAATAIPPAAPATLDALLPSSRTTAVFLAALLFVAFAMLVAVKSRDASRAASAAGAEARPLVTLPMWVRACGGGLCLAVGVLLEVHLDSGTWGGVAILGAVLLAAHRSPRWIPRSRAPGRWLPVTTAEAFAKPRRQSSWLDSSTRGGKVTLLLVTATIGALVWVVSRTSMYHAWLVGLDAVVFLAILGTGKRSELPPDPVAGRAALLESVAERMAKTLAGKAYREAEGVRVVPRVRIPQGSADADELRLLVVPRAPLQGFGGIEIGAAVVPGSGTPVLLPEVLLRVREGSPCEAALARICRHARSTRGRKPGERVLAFSPRLPTARMTAAIAVALAARTGGAAASTGPAMDTAAAAVATDKRRRAPRAKAA